MTVDVSWTVSVTVSAGNVWVTVSRTVSAGSVVTDVTLGPVTMTVPLGRVVVPKTVEVCDGPATRLAPR